MDTIIFARILFWIANNREEVYYINYPYFVDCSRTSYIKATCKLNLINMDHAQFKRTYNIILKALILLH